MGIGVGFGLGPVRVSTGVSSRTLAQGCLPLFVFGLIIWMVKAILTALYVFLSWPSRVVGPVARQAGLDHVYQVGVQWAAAALWVEFLLVILGLLVAASEIRNLFLGAPGMKSSARFWRFWAVTLFVPVTAATVGMAQAPEPVGTKMATSPVITKATPTPTPTSESRPAGAPASAQQAIVMTVSSGDTLGVKAIAPGSVLPSTNQTVVRLLGIAAPHGAECKADWATGLLTSYLPRSSHIWIARGAGSRGAGAPLAVYLWKEGSDRAMVNAWLLVNGAARLETTEVRGEVQRKFAEYESKARAAHRGIHSCAG
ncbi:thermonuclease family protein [Sphaerimonospora cavernae]|uniref:Thermonuclease family protein n=1 Tax=Sphaerimonospora cavernae TaxID=1740611 RepID=A0ABV6U5T8_9ACTN